MINVVCKSRACKPFAFRRGASGGYTLVELLMATTLSLMLLLGVVSVFATISASVSDARAILETADRLRAAKNLLQQDLAGLTVSVQPPRRAESNEGYLELIEGPLGAMRPVWDPQNPADSFAWNSDAAEPDTTAADLGDIIMFTTRRTGLPFVGRFQTPTSMQTIESQVAEVAWFVRGNTLYRRVLLVAPHVLSLADGNGNSRIDAADLTDAAGIHSYYEWYDVSARPVFAPGSGNLAGWIPNTLGDLTKRENRFAHWVHGTQPFPFDASLWGLLGLPTLHECSHPDWMTWTNLSQVPMAPHAFRPGRPPAEQPQVDLWASPHTWVFQSNPPPIPPMDPITGVLTQFQVAPDTNSDGQPDVRLRVGEDVVLTNVIGFDVKVWDPQAPVVSDGNVVLQPGDPGYPAALQDALGPNPTFQVMAYGAYVDLGYGGSAVLAAAGDRRSGLADLYPDNTTPRVFPTRVYDTWSLYYEHDGTDQWNDGLVDLGTDGFDNNNDGVVDDSAEMEAPPPYPVPLRGIQVRIRVFEPDTKQIREVTVVQDFRK